MPPDVLQLQLPLPHPQPGSRRQETLADRLCDLLIRRGRPLEVGHVVAQVLRVRQCPEALQRRLVAEIVDADSRLTWRGRDLVGLAPPGWATTPVADAGYCVVDLETTGGVPGKAKITEIGAVRLRGGRIVDRFTTLVNPGHEIPAPIMRITGIRDEMLVGQPRIDEVLPRFVEFVGDDVMVAHNAPFDLRFLNYERHRVEGTYFTQPWLDTLILARRLLRGRIERFDLGSLARWADTEAQPNHRALPDAHATAEVLSRLLGLLADRGVETLAQAVVFGQTGGARHAHKLALAEHLPQRPGIYMMRDRSGAVLYIGKARNLRRRVRSYFGPQGKHGRLIARALDAVVTIDHSESPSELMALLTETRLIREHRPPCNTRGVRAATRFIKVTVGDPVPRAFVVAEVLDDDAAYFGPIRSDRLARDAVACLHALYPLSAHRRGGAPDPGQQDLLQATAVRPGDAVHDVGRDAADRVCALLGSDAGTASMALMDLLAAKPQAVAAVGTPAGRETFAALLGVVATLARVRAAADACGIVVEPDDAGLHATFVAAGRVVTTMDLARAPSAAIEAALHAQAGVATAAERPVAPSRAELADAIVLHDWLRARADQAGVIVLEPGFRVDRALERLRRVMTELWAPGMDGDGTLVDAA